MENALTLTTQTDVITSCSPLPNMRVWGWWWWCL